MTMKRHRGATIVAVLIGLGVVATPNAAATVVVTVSIDDHQVAQFSGTDYANQFFNSLTHTDSMGNVTTFTKIAISASSNAPGDTQGNLSQTHMESWGSTGSGVLKVDVLEKDLYYNPGTSGSGMLLVSGVSRSDGQAQTLTFQSYVSTGLLTDITGGLQTFDPTRPSDASPNTVTTAFIRGDSYSLHNVLTLQAGSRTINVNGTQQVFAILNPEPPSIVAAITGLPVLALGIRRRLRSRRR